MEYVNKLKEFSNLDIEDLKTKGKLKRISEFDKNSVIAFTYNNIYELYYTKDGKIFIKDIQGSYMYVDNEKASK